MEQTAVKERERFVNTPDSKVPIQGKYKRNIVELAKATFRISFRNVSLNRKYWRFEILLVDADEKHVKEFLNDYPMCSIENTFSKVQKEDHSIFRNPKSRFPTPKSA